MTYIGVVVATYGDLDQWRPLAQRAMRSLDGQGEYRVVHVHNETLALARNEGAAMLGMERPVGTKRATELIFCDADDELGPGYLSAMRRALARIDAPMGAIFRPNTQGVHDVDGTEEPPRMIPRTDMRRSNCCVIGTMIGADLFSDIGGFDEYPVLEDWALFRKAMAAGAALVDVEDAIYRIHIRPDSRNTPGALHSATYKRIRKDIPL